MIKLSLRLNYTTGVGLVPQIGLAVVHALAPLSKLIGLVGILPTFHVLRL